MKYILAAAAFLGFLSVALGAAGTHGFAAVLEPGNRAAFDTALRYHQLYSVLLFCVGLYGLNGKHGKLLTAACVTFLAGLVVFSGSLYCFALTDIRAFSFLTPVGGLTLMAGWILLILAALTGKSRD